MKTINKYALPLFMAVVATAVIAGLYSCSSDEPGAPFISYVRVTDPKKSDSLLAAAGQGQMVAIIGGNLGSVRQIWFNDKQATTSASFVTNTSVLTTLPSDVPTKVSNKLKMIFANGDSLLYDFVVAINKPELDYAGNEYTKVGDSLFIYGKYLYKPLTVKFTGSSAPAEILSLNTDATVLAVRVPNDAQKGPITVTSNFGETESSFWLNDDRNIFANFDGPFSGAWKGSDYVVASDPTIPQINGNFLRVNKGSLGAYPFLEVYGGPTPSDVATLTKNIPAGAYVAPLNYSLKFEINTLASITGAYMRLYMGNADGGGFDAARQGHYYVWMPNLDTHGKWATVTIPWNDVYTANQSFPQNTADGSGLFIYFHGPNAAKYNFAMDNFRVVPNTK